MTQSVEISVVARLLETGMVRASARNQVLINRFETARWIEPSGRKNEWKVRESAINALEKRLNELNPSWRADFDFLRSISRDPFDPSDIDALPRLLRPITVTGMINRRNWNAAKGLGPKHRSRVPANATLTKDWVLRFRPNSGMRGKTTGSEIDFNEMASLLTECFIPERAWIKILEIAGTVPRLIITCENLGAYVDLPVTDSMLVIYSPGADTEPAIKLLNMLPTATWLHFGDLDHEGVEIAERISAETGRDLDLFIPRFAIEYLEGAPAVKTAWGKIPDLPIFTDLKRNKKRIFQEVFMLDERLADELARINNELSKNKCMSLVAEAP